MRSPDLDSEAVSLQTIAENFSEPHLLAFNYPGIFAEEIVKVIWRHPCLIRRFPVIDLTGRRYEDGIRFERHPAVIDTWWDYQEAGSPVAKNGLIAGLICWTILAVIYEDKLSRALSDAKPIVEHFVLMVRSDN
jgi:hypothetical protein